MHLRDATHGKPFFSPFFWKSGRDHTRLFFFHDGKGKATPGKIFLKMKKGDGVIRVKNAPETAEKKGRGKAIIRVKNALESAFLYYYFSLQQKFSITLLCTEQ